MPTRPAIPMPGGTEPEPRPENRPDVDPTLGLRPESLARLGEADLDLLAQLQAELRGGPRPASEDAANGIGSQHPGSDTHGGGRNGPPGPAAYETGPDGTHGYPAAGHNPGPNTGAHGTGAYPPAFGPNGNGMPGGPEATGRNAAWNGGAPNGTGAPYGVGPNGNGAWPHGGPGAPFPGAGYDSPTNGTGYHQVSYQDGPDRRGPRHNGAAPTPPDQDAERNGDREKRGRNGSARHGTGSFRAFGGRRRGRNGRGGPDGGPPDMAG